MATLPNCSNVGLLLVAMVGACAATLQAGGCQKNDITPVEADTEPKRTVIVETPGLESDDEGVDKDKMIPTTVTPPPDGYWFKVMVHGCLPVDASKLVYVIHDENAAIFRNQVVAFETKKNSFQSPWIPMEEGRFSLEVVEFVDADGEVLLTIPRDGREEALPFQFELTRGTPSVGTTLPSHKEYGRCIEHR